MNLFRRRWAPSPWCLFCDHEEESVEPIFFLWPYFQAVWRASGFSYVPNAVPFPCFAEWRSHVQQEIPDFGNVQALSLIAFHCWERGKSRCRFVFEHRQQDPFLLLLMRKREASGNSRLCRKIPPFQSSPTKEKLSWIGIRLRWVLIIHVDAVLQPSSHKTVFSYAILSLVFLQKRIAFSWLEKDPILSKEGCFCRVMNLRTPIDHWLCLLFVLRENFML